MKNQYQIKKKTRQAAETLLAFNGTQWQAQRIARALSYVYTQADETLDFLTRDGGCVLAEYRVNKRERPSIRTTTTTRTKRKVTK